MNAQEIVDTLLETDDMQSDEMAHEVYQAAINKRFNDALELLSDNSGTYASSRTWGKILVLLGLEHRPWSWTAANTLASMGHDIHYQYKDPAKAWDDIVHQGIESKMCLRPDHMDILKRLLASIPQDIPRDEDEL